VRGTLALAAVIASSACGSSAPVPPPAPPVARPKPVEPSEPAGILAGYVDAHVLKVVATNEGAAVLLFDESSGTVLPIFIGGTEATSIDLRQRGVPPARPLTHDLLDTVVKRLRGTLVKVQVDALRDGVFYGSVFIRVVDDSGARRIIKFDARPSDALALAIGNKAPIYVAKKVFADAGIAKDEILRQLAKPGGETI
jgi:bifunctional DNase/RNase